MNLQQNLRRIFENEDINFLLTNRIPRTLLTHAMGWFSRIRQPLVCRMSIAVWKLFTDLDLSDAAQPHFASLHACFTRQLKAGARPVDKDNNTITSPSDGIVGECGQVSEGRMFQAKGMAYTLAELLGSAEDAQTFNDGCYVTLRLTSAMYHRFHAPHDMWIDRVNYISGDTWNVNPIALKRIERLFCRNERAVIHARLVQSGYRVALVPVAAILVASIRLHFVDVLLHLKYRGPKHITCHANAAKGQELGWFEHGSTIIVLGPRGFSMAAGLQPGSRIRMGRPLMQLP
jgi:phosphatidylserine decarboxylase